MSHSIDPLNSERLPPENRPPKVLRFLMGLALLGLLAGAGAILFGLISNSRIPLSGSLQLDETIYPGPQSTLTSGAYPSLPTRTLDPSIYPGPIVTTPANPYPGAATQTAAVSAYPGPGTQSSQTPVGSGFPTATPIIGDPAELTQFPTRTSAPTSTAFSLAASNWCVPWNSPSQIAQVKEVIDGATFEIEVEGQRVQVRYIGVELPGVQGSLAYEQALSANQNLVEGKWVTLIKDRSDINQQNQWVRYVLAEGVFVNHELIRQGLARANSYPPDISCDVFFLEAQRLAQAANLGIWTLAAVPTRTLVPTSAPLAVSGDVRVVFISPKGEGWQDPEEFAEIRNLSSYPVQLSGWTLSDEKGHKFTFPDLALISGGYCRIYTNQYVPERCGLSYYSLSAIWDDAGDCAYLRDPYGNLVNQFCY